MRVPCFSLCVTSLINKYIIDLSLNSIETVNVSWWLSVSHLCNHQTMFTLFKLISTYALSPIFYEYNNARNNIYIYIYIYIIRGENLRGRSIRLLNVNGYRRIINLGFKIQSKLNVQSPQNYFYIEIKRKKNHFFWCHYKFISRRDDYHQMLHEKKFIWVFLYFLPARIGFEKKNSFFY